MIHSCCYCCGFIPLSHWLITAALLGYVWRTNNPKEFIILLFRWATLNILTLTHSNWFHFDLRARILCNFIWSSLSMSCIDPTIAARGGGWCHNKNATKLITKAIMYTGARIVQLWMEVPQRSSWFNTFFTATEGKTRVLSTHSCLCIDWFNSNN